MRDRPLRLRPGRAIIVAMDGDTLDPGAEIACAMAEMTARHEHWAEALGWLEVCAERAVLPPRYEELRAQWIRRARRHGASPVPRARRRQWSPAPLYG